MKDIKRQSPVVFPATPLKTEPRDNYTVVLSYHGEGEGPYLVDLSHRTRLDLQSPDLSAFTPFGISIPETPGRSVLKNGILINRMNRTQTSIYHLTGQTPALPAEMAYTRVSDGTLFVAIFGKQVFSLCEKLTALDFMDPNRTAPFLYQGPFSHVPCQIVTLNRDTDFAGLVLTCSRGYGRDMIHGILHAGKEFGLTPAGEERFTTWITSLQEK